MVGTSLEARVSVTGCTSVKGLAVYAVLPGGAEKFLKNATWTANPTPITINQNEIPYGQVGIAAHLSLKAKATCDDDRTSFSQAVSVVFFPVAQVIEKGGAQVLPDVFVADGQGANALFYGCSGGTSPGTTMLVRVNAAGEVSAVQQNIPYGCDISSNITPRNNPSAKRWMWTNGVGAFAFDANLNVSGTSPEKTNAIGVMPNGDAIVWNQSALQQSLKWISHVNSAVKWSSDPQGQLAGSPMLRVGYGVYVPELFYEFSNNTATFRVESFDENNGTSLNVYNITSWTYGTGDTPIIPQSAFNGDGSVVYLPVPLAGFQSSQVWACSTVGGCTGTNQKWKTVDLPGYVQVVVPFHGGAKLAAVAANVTWFIDAATGQVINSGGKGIEPAQGLMTLGIEANRNGQDVYLLNGPIPAQGQLTYPTEIVAVDAPATGELFRYEVDGMSLMAALDDGGQLWMRIGPNMVKPLPLADYRAVLPAQ